MLHAPQIWIMITKINIKRVHIRGMQFFYPSIDQQYRVDLYFVYWIKYHQSTPVQTNSSEIKQSFKTISNEIKNNL